MDLIEPKLSSRAQQFWPKALVICKNHGSGLEQWMLHRNGRPTEIGDSFDRAERTLQEMARTERRP